ncbi:ABC transporter permease [Luteolibacter sp. Populi]|uniref:ABC transporter permease n=1 Tax=Luteolibacter sp. Populi TaxID=3230487 RepID=UPI003465447C
MDSFRLLKARRLFWITFGISLVVAIAYASIGFDKEGMTLFFGAKSFENPILREGQPEAAAFYVLLFTDGMVGLWLAWFAMGLALISTAGIFPDFISEGSIGISLSKPIGRLQLFLTKFAGGLLFVALQVGVFTLVVFLAIGFRIDEWNFTLFWAVPVTTFVFGLLYSVAVCVGIWTRSTLIALLSAILMWVLSWICHWTEEKFYLFAYTIPEAGLNVDWSGGGGVKETTGETPKPEEGMVKAHAVARSIGSPLPKTRDCTLYLKHLIVMKERDSMLSGISMWDLMTGSLPNSRTRAAAKKAEERHSAWYVFGTSAAFGAVMLSLGAWVFCRRDY